MYAVELTLSSQVSSSPCKISISRYSARFSDLSTIWHSPTPCRCLQSPQSEWPSSLWGSDFGFDLWRTESIFILKSSSMISLSMSLSTSEWWSEPEYAEPSDPPGLRLTLSLNSCEPPAPTWILFYRIKIEMNNLSVNAVNLDKYLGNICCSPSCTSPGLRDLFLLFLFSILVYFF